jgi:Exopolyphosphatase-related proteins
MERVHDWVKKKPSRVLIITHRNGDVDGVASSIAAKRLILRINRKAKVHLVSPEGTSFQAKRVVDALKEEFIDKIPEDGYELIIITDTGHSSLLKEEVEVIRSAKAKKVLIDHHPLDSSMKGLADVALVDEEASSASEMVLRLFKELKIRPDKKACNSIALGIMSDSQFLTIAKGQTIIAMAELVNYGVDVEKIRSILRYRRDPSEQIARIKGVLRSEFYRSQSWIIGCTEVGSYHASVARALVELGCDVALAAGEIQDGTRGSIRSSQAFYLSSKIHLGNDVCKVLAEKLGGSGGGHPTAGAFNTAKSYDEVKKTFLRIVEDELGERLKKIV